MIKNGRGRIRCYVAECPNWATEWRRVWIEQEVGVRFAPVCDIDDPSAERVVTEHQEEADV